jgi:hypothetical protein
MSTPAPAQQQPGGGQAGVAGSNGPPPTPPADPEPTVAVAEVAPPQTISDWLRRAWESGLRRADDRFAVVTPGVAPRPAIRVAEMQGVAVVSDPRLASFAPFWQAALDDLARALAQRFSGASPLARTSR